MIVYCFTLGVICQKELEEKGIYSGIKKARNLTS